ncbi:T9SS type A sorting domain-containing protein [Cryomorphaceae bacterium 1068]|nr:T9SS type A sorting domain-containing protein [Cryomorphaceae bacterium 1068]
MKIRSLLSAMLLLVASFSWAQNTECSGTLTANNAIDGGTPFVNGYNYNFSTSGGVVTATFELLDPQIGLVGIFQTFNPDFSETTVVAMGGSQEVSADFPGFTDGDTFTCRIQWNFAGGFSRGEELTYTVGENCGIIPPDPVVLPVDFESTTADYAFENFAGGFSSVIPNPTPSGINTSATVAQMVKGPGDVFGGSVLPLDSPIDFSENKLFKMKVYSPRSGARVLLKVENASNSGIFFEKEDTSTVANEWETLEFDFSAINTGNEYSRIVLIWDLGVVGDGTPNFTFQFDDIELVMSDIEPPSQVALPIDFEDETLDYGLTDFGGTVSSIVADPEDAGNTAVQTIRTAGAAVFAGTTVGQPLGLEEPIPFDFDNTGMSARVWSPEAGVIVKLKIEQVGNPGIFVEKDVLTTTSGAWETLEFDFAQPTAGSLNLDLVYNLPTIFFNFGADPGLTPEQTYFWDDVDFAPGVGGFIPTALPIDFDTPDVTFGLIDFGGNESTIIPDPEDAGNNVVQSIRTEGAAFFAGTTVPAGGLTNRIPFEAGETTMSVRVWSPEVGIPVRMKLEATGSPGLVAEKELTTTTSGEWETIFFDFSVDALVPVDVNADFNIVSLFFNFNVDQVNPAPEQIYLWDDVAFGGIPSSDCLNDAAFGSADISVEGPNGQLITISTCSYEEEYSTITGVPVGEDIEFTLDADGDGGYITVRSDSATGPIVAEGPSPLTVASASGADLYPHWNTDDSCGTLAECVVTTVQCVSCETECPDGNIGDACDDGDENTVGDVIGEDCVCAGQPLTGDCLNEDAFGSADLSTEANNLVTISTCSFQTEYSTITGVSAGEDIEFSIVEGGYITVRSDSANGAVVAQGTSPVTVSGASGSDLFAHWNTDAACGQATDCVETTVQCLTCGTDCPDGNIGDPCDDGDPLTEGETIQEDCSCGGGIVVPANDNCEGATDIACGTTIEGTTVGASATEGLNNLCNGFASTTPEDVWYTFQANGSDNYTVTVLPAEGSLIDGVLFIYSGDCGSLTEVACSDTGLSAGSGEGITLEAPAAGTYYVRTFAYFDAGDITVSLDCESGCANPFPAVDQSSLTSTVLPNGKLRFEWEPVPGQIGCQINIVVGTGPQQATVVRAGASASSFTAPLGQLVPFTTYNFRVRCGCSQGPLVVGPYTNYAQAFYAPPVITEEMGTGYTDTPLSQVDPDAQWNNSNLSENIVGQLFDMASSGSWVRVAPNPAQDNVSLSYNSLSEGQAFIRVFDAQGKLAFEKAITFNKGFNNVNLNLNELGNGIYVVEVLKGESRESVRLLMQ